MRATSLHDHDASSTTAIIATCASLLPTRIFLASRYVRRGDARAIVRKRAAKELPVAFGFAQLEVFQSFDALQQSIQVTTIPAKAAGGWRGLIIEGLLRIPWLLPEAT
jgi:hypothetical protein